MAKESQKDQDHFSEAQLSPMHEAHGNSRKRRQKDADVPKKRRRSGGEHYEAEKIDKSSLKQLPRKGDAQVNPASTSKSTQIQIHAQPTRPGHVRFGSEDPPQHAEDEQDEQANDEFVDEDEGTNDSDEDAPEDITTAAAQATSRASQAQAARAAESQRQNAKKKRREREARLKEQANLSARSNRRIKASELPDLLPEEVLADDSYTRAPTPPTAAEEKEDTSSIMNTRKIKFEDNGPKDIQVGPVKVSVLEKRNGLLAPKASSRTQSLKHQWLLGRRGSVVNRQSMAKGFIRS